MTTEKENEVDEVSSINDHVSEEEVVHALSECANTITNIALATSDDFMEVPWLKKNS